MKEDVLRAVLTMCGIICVIGGTFFATFAYEKSDSKMNNQYDVWFEGKKAYSLAATSNQLAYAPENFAYLLNVNDEMEIVDVLQHQYHSSNGQSNISYSIQYKNGQNELQSYQFTRYEKVKVVYKENIDTPLLKRLENEVYQNNNRKTVKIPKYMNYIIYVPEKTTAINTVDHYKRCTGNRGNNNYRCTTYTEDAESIINP